MVGLPWTVTIVCLDVSVYKVNNGIVFMQMDQELGFILGKSDAKRTFVRVEYYVPAIISYGEKLRKPGVSEIISTMNSSGKYIYLVCELVEHIVINFIDETSRQLTALKLLARCFAYRQLQDNLTSFYEEYNVSY